MPRLDQTQNGYGNILRQRLLHLNYSQHDVELKLGLTPRSLSGLINGRTFMSKERVEKLLDHLQFNAKEKVLLTESINRQRLYPVIRDPFLNTRIKAVRVMQGLRGDELASDELSIATITQVEAGLTTVGGERLNRFERTLGQRIEFTPDERSRIEGLLTDYSQEEILTVAFYLINQYQSRNTRTDPESLEVENHGK